MLTPRSATPEPITVVDLFSGCGASPRGSTSSAPPGSSAGPLFHSIAAVEHNRAAAATYAVNFGELRKDRRVPAARVHVGDIEAWEPTPEALHADVVVGGLRVRASQP